MFLMRQVFERQDSGKKSLTLAPEETNYLFFSQSGQSHEIIEVQSTNRIALLRLNRTID